MIETEAEAEAEAEPEPDTEPDAATAPGSSLYHCLEIAVRAQVWNVVRTEAEIQATMNTPLAGNEAGLVGYWRFDDDQGNLVAVDTSSSQNNGSLGNGESNAAPGFAAVDVN